MQILFVIIKMFQSCSQETGQEKQIRDLQKRFLNPEIQSAGITYLPSYFGMNFLNWFISYRDKFAILILPYY